MVEEDQKVEQQSDQAFQEMIDGFERDNHRLERANNVLDLLPQFGERVGTPEGPAQYDYSQVREIYESAQFNDLPDFERRIIRARLVLGLRRAASVKNKIKGRTIPELEKIRTKLEGDLIHQAEVIDLATHDSLDELDTLRGDLSSSEIELLTKLKASDDAQRSKEDEIDESNFPDQPQGEDTERGVSMEADKLNEFLNVLGLSQRQAAILRSIIETGGVTLAGSLKDVLKPFVGTDIDDQKLNYTLANDILSIRGKLKALALVNPSLRYKLENRRGKGYIMVASREELNPEEPVDTRELKDQGEGLEDLVQEQQIKEPDVRKPIEPLTAVELDVLNAFLTAAHYNVATFMYQVYKSLSVHTLLPRRGSEEQFMRKEINGDMVRIYKIDRDALEDIYDTAMAKFNRILNALHDNPEASMLTVLRNSLRDQGMSDEEISERLLHVPVGRYIEAYVSFVNLRDRKYQTRSDNRPTTGGDYYDKANASERRSVNADIKRKFGRSINRFNADNPSEYYEIRRGDFFAAFTSLNRS